jgi:hypothetical protein
MRLSWLFDRGLDVPTKARLVDDSEAEALRRKVESVNWQPPSGFLKDRQVESRRIIRAREQNLP